MPSGPERSHIDDEAILHVALQHALVGSIDVRHPDDLDVRGDSMSAAEIQQFLGFGNAPDDRAGDGLAAQSS